MYSQSSSNTEHTLYNKRHVRDACKENIQTDLRQPAGDELDQRLHNIRARSRSDACANPYARPVCYLPANHRPHAHLYLPAHTHRDGPAHPNAHPADIRHAFILLARHADHARRV